MSLIFANVLLFGDPLIVKSHVGTVYLNTFIEIFELRGGSKGETGGSKGTIGRYVLTRHRKCARENCATRECTIRFDPDFLHMQ